MNQNLVLEDVVLIGKKAWQKIGFDLFLPMNEEEKAIIAEAINAPDPFFEGKVKDNQVLVYIPSLDDSDNFSIKWWQNILEINQFPLYLQFTDVYNISCFFNRLRVEPGWHLYTAKALPESTEKSWSEQRQLLSDGYTAPNVCELVSFFALSCLNGTTLESREVFGRTVDDFYGLPLVVAPALNGRVTVLPEGSDQETKTNVGIYACRKII
jgi:hypothetical protein